MARIKLGVPDVKEIREGETEHRYIKGKGLVGYTKYENQIYSSNLYPSAVPPIIDKKQNNIINNTVTTVSVSDVDLSDSSSAPSAVIANGDHILFLDATSGNGLRKESLSDLSSFAFKRFALIASCAFLNASFCFSVLSLLIFGF